LSPATLVAYFLFPTLATQKTFLKTISNVLEDTCSYIHQMANYFITGCFRGLSLAFAKQLASLAPSNVGTIFATARSETPALYNLVESCGDRVVFIKLDVTNQSNINDAVKYVESTLQGRGLDVLINNAGILPLTPDSVHAMTNLDEVLHTNVTGAHMVTSAFLPLLKDGKEKKVANM